MQKDNSLLMQAITYLKCNQKNTDLWKTILNEFGFNWIGVTYYGDILILGFLRYKINPNIFILAILLYSHKKS